MKTIHEYTDEELVVLDVDEVQHLIDLHCALAGAPLLPEEPIKPEELTVECDAIVYQVKFNYSTLSSFKTLTEAQNVADALNAAGRLYVSTLREGDLKVDYVTSDSVSDASVVKVHVLSKQKKTNLEGELVKYKTNSARYYEQVEKYNEAAEKRADTVSLVEDTVTRAYDRISTIKDALSKFDRYLTIAEEDKPTALKFFNASYPELTPLLPEDKANPASENKAEENKK